MREKLKCFETLKQQSQILAKKLLETEDMNVKLKANLMHFQERLEESIKSKAEVIKSNYLFIEEEKKNIFYFYK